jgi:hypothetical protein
MNGVAAEVAQEVAVLFQDKHLDASPSQQVAGHQAGRSAARDKYCSVLGFDCHGGRLEPNN